MSARLLEISLDDKYLLESGRIYVNGTQALARLPFIQRRRDGRAGLHTAGFISGYRGSPLGSFDQALWQAQRIVADNAIHFRPAINEDLAATAVWGTQQVNAFGGAKYDGVFGLWYGKGPGVDRSGDVFKHGNAAGSSPHGGVLLLAGDDHAAKSSTLPHQSDYAFMDAGIPVLAPAGIQEFAEFGVLGWAMSRYSGCWVGFKALTSAIDSSSSIDAAAGHALDVRLPTDFVPPPDGVHLRLTDDWWQPEARLYRWKLPAAQAFARANELDRILVDSGTAAALGIVTSGKAYLDLLEALELLGVDPAAAARLGLRIYKIGLVWPLDKAGLAAFADGLEEILVVEEKRPLLEAQVKEHLFGRQGPRGPLRVIGKSDETGMPLLPVVGELDPLALARIIGERLLRLDRSGEGMAASSTMLCERAKLLPAEAPPVLKRPPHFCPGCPHNTSTRVPEGSKAAAGIGCHIMARIMERDTSGFTQMGGEGVQWVGMAPFSSLPHLFQNLGDGTYFHSGLLAIRQAVAAKVNITYKLLYNGGVAMTGGQPVDGELSVADIVRQCAAERVERIVVVSDEPEKYAVGSFPADVTIHHRDALDVVQRSLREVPGVSILVYDQTCAAEKRRRRKRGTMAEATRRVVINELVCEGCGDCSTQSNCLSVVPLETPFGTKRRIEQSSCNKDFSCLKGFCPSFVTVAGGSLRKGTRGGGAAAQLAALPDPAVPSPVTDPFDILVTGVGGTGVVTIGALLGMAAHLEGYQVSVMDMTGAAQKGGAVHTHVRIADRTAPIHAVRIPAGGARLLLGCDLVVAAEAEVLGRAAKGRTRAIVNEEETITAEFTRRSATYEFPDAALRRRIAEALGGDAVEFVAAGALTASLLGDAIGVNLFMLGYAWQKGLVPLAAASLERAIEVNGVAIDFNKAAFSWGRLAAYDAAAVREAAGAPNETAAESFAEMVARRVRFLTDYQDRAYAVRYEQLVERVAEVEALRIPHASELKEAVAKNYFKLMAYKDEYEVARLYTESGFLARLAEMFEGDYRLEFHLAPPLTAPRDAAGLPTKRKYGAAMLRLFRMLARVRRLRGTAFDIFGYSAERRTERRLILDYERLIQEHILPTLSPANHVIAVELAALPDAIRGFGHVKQRNLVAAKERESVLLERLAAASAARALAAE